MGRGWAGRSWILDGHNAIFALPELSALQERGEGAAARAQLESWLLPFASRLREPLTVVYDGNRRSGGAGAEAGPLLRIFFSEPPREADDVILDLARAALAQGRQVAVVSNDRRTLASRLPEEVLFVGVEEFRRRWVEPPKATAQEEKHLPPEDERAVAGRLMAHHAENRPLTPGQVRGRERQARRRWLALHGREPAERADRAGGPPASPARRGAAGTGAGGRPARRHGAVAAPAGGSGKGAAQPEGGGAGTGEDRAREASRELEREREAKRRRGLRGQARRLEALARRRGAQKARTARPAKRNA